jgi:glutathione peroxidase
MKKIFFACLLVIGSLSVSAQKQVLYDFKVNDIDGKAFDLSSLKGKKVLVVNTASKCGNTPQYEALEKLYKKYGPENFVIIGFPANDFMRQEPGTNAEIKEFCTKKYAVTFPMMEKISVKGDEMAGIYKWLTSKELNGFADYSVGWNFSKFLIDEKGNVVGHVAPSTQPDCEEILTWLSK